MSYFMRLVPTLLILVIILGFPLESKADWDPNGNPVATSDDDELGQRIVTNGKGGFYVVYQRMDGSESDIYVQKIDMNGNTDPAYPNGRKIYNGGYIEHVNFDGEQLIIVLYNDYYERLDIGRWNENYSCSWITTLSNNIHNLRKHDNDVDVHNGFVYVTYINNNYELRAAKLYLSDGYPYWNEEVVLTQTVIKRHPRITGDEEGGAIVIWVREEYEATSIKGQRLDEDGDRMWVDHGSTDWGIWLCINAGTVRYPKILHYDQPAGTPDDYYFLWENYRTDDNWDIYALKYDINQNNLWGVDNGKRVTYSVKDQTNYDAEVVNNGFVVVMEHDNYDGQIYYTKMSASGGMPWGFNLKPLCTSKSFEPNIEIVQDGNFITAWKDIRNEPGPTYAGDIYSQKIRGQDGGIDWQANGVPVCTAEYEQYSPRIASNILGAVTAWTYVFPGSYPNKERDIYANTLGCGLSAQVSAFKKRAGGQLDPMPEYYAVGCPQGDGDELLISIEFTDITEDIPADAITIGQAVNGNVFLSWDTPPNADSPATEANGYVTTVTHGFISGCGIDEVPVYVYDFEVGRATINVKSPDENNDQIVDITDMSNFGITYLKCEGDPEYDVCFDYVIDPYPSCVDVTDFAIFALHYQHAYSGGGPNPSSPIAPESDVGLHLTFDKSTFDAKSSLSSIAVGLENASEVSSAALVLNLVGDHLFYSGFTPNSEFSGTVHAIPMEKERRKLIYIIASSSKSTPSDFRNLGSILIRNTSGRGVTQEDINFELGDVVISNSRIACISNTECLEKPEQVVLRNQLNQNYPNPFNPTTTIQYSLSEESPVNLSIYNTQGRLIRSLVNEVQSASIYEVLWNGTDNNGRIVASGVYWCRIKIGAFAQSKKMVLLK